MLLRNEEYRRLHGLVCAVADGRDLHRGVVGRARALLDTLPLPGAKRTWGETPQDRCPRCGGEGRPRLIQHSLFHAKDDEVLAYKCAFCGLVWMVGDS